MHKISTGLNKTKPHDRTALVALDLTTAFDTVSISLCFWKMSSLPPSQTPLKVAHCHLRGCGTYVEFRELKKVRQGVPQGGVLSPALFNTYMSLLPTPPPNIKVVSYAYDITILSSGTKPMALYAPISTYLGELVYWLEEHNICLSAEKSTTMLFIYWTKEVGCTLIP